MAPSVLNISVEVDTLISRAQFTGSSYMPLIVRAHNPLSQPVTIQMTPGTPFATFQVKVAAPGAFPFTSTGFSRSPRHAYFEGGETKSFVFDLYVAKDWGGLGEWVVGGAYGARWSDSAVSFRYVP